MWSRTKSLNMANKTTISAIFIKTLIFKSNPSVLLPIARHIETRSKRFGSIDLYFKTNTLATDKPRRVIVIKFQNLPNTFAYLDCIHCSYKLKRKIVHLNPKSTELKLYFIKGKIRGHGCNGKREPFTFQGP